MPDVYLGFCWLESLLHQLAVKADCNGFVAPSYGPLFDPMSKHQYPLTVYFDGLCPLCVAEINQLQQLNADGHLQFEGIHAPDFSIRFPHIDPESADRVLHAEYADGTLIYGLDVTHQIWRAVNQKRWLVILRWPLIRWFADIAYRIFARNRYSLSYLLTGVRRCESCVIQPSNKSARRA